MPYVMDWPPKRLLAVVAAAFAMLITASSAQAATTSSGCTPLGSVSQVFSQFGDNANYALVPGGDFLNEDTSGWTFNNASLVSGGEPWNVSGSTEGQSLNIQPGGQATSPSICISNLIPDMRFFAQSQSQSSYGWNNDLRVLAQWSYNGMSGTVPIGRLSSNGFQSWEPSNTLMLGAPLPDGMTVPVQLVFQNSSNASWNIDDVYVDPYAK